MGRTIVLLIAGLAMVLASAGLALGSIRVAENALQETARAQLRYRKSLGSIPRVVIGEHEILFEHELIATIDNVLRDDSPTFKIDALFERLELWRKQHGMSACDPLMVCLDNVVMIQVGQAVDSRLLWKVNNTVFAAGFDAIYAPLEIHSKTSW